MVKVSGPWGRRSSRLWLAGGVCRCCERRLHVCTSGTAGAAPSSDGLDTPPPPPEVTGRARRWHEWETTGEACSNHGDYTNTNTNTPARAHTGAHRRAPTKCGPGAARPVFGACARRCRHGRRSLHHCVLHQPGIEVNPNKRPVAQPASPDSWHPCSVNYNDLKLISSSFCKILHWTNSKKCDTILYCRNCASSDLSNENRSCVNSYQL